MAKLTWHNNGDNRYETGVSECALFVKNADGTYETGVAWNGITAITESPEGAEATALYADNIKYLNLISAEELNGTIEAYTYPDEWAACNGEKAYVAGVNFGQQNRSAFGLVYKTKYSDENNADYYKLHIIYNATASPSERAYNTINDSPEAITFSWEFSTIPVNLTTPGFKPTAIVTIDSRAVAAANQSKLTALLNKLYGTASTDPELPTPDEIIAFFSEDGVTVTYTLTNNAGSTANPLYVLKGGTNRYNVTFIPNVGYSFPTEAPVGLVTGATLVTGSYRVGTDGKATFGFNTVTGAVTITLTATADT